jgi:4-diphosphocytidyl-2C-methyl-D-erythritol kinase
MNDYKKITVFANAKINLELNVLGKRPDGYHNISTIFQSVSLCDEITVLNFGTVLAQGTPEVALNDPEVIKAYIGG